MARLKRGRRQHQIKHNKGNESPRHCVWLDCETVGVSVGGTKKRQELVYGYAEYARLEGGIPSRTGRSVSFKQNTKFWDWLLEIPTNKVRLWVFAHNLGFDFTVLAGFTTLQAAGWFLDKCIIESPPTFISLKDYNGAYSEWHVGKTAEDKIGLVWNGRRILFVDSVNYFQMPLEQLGESVGIKKLTLPKGLGDNEETARYCQNDVAILRRAIIRWIRFLRENDLGAFRISLASQSFAAYTHRFMEHPIFIHTNTTATNLERTGYFGGRTECFRIGEIKERTYALDINSQYPAVMLSGVYPTNHKTSRKFFERDWFDEQLDTMAVMARVIIETDKPWYPVRHEGKLMFPVGTFETTLATPELRHAQKHGHLKEPLECAVYEQNPIFREFVEFFYTLRQERAAAGDEAERFFFKRLLQALYGKFGQRGDFWTEIDEMAVMDNGYWNAIDAETKVVRSLRAINGTVQEKQRGTESYNAFPAIAAHVTSYARLLLLSYINTAGPENVVYCDTDSVFVNERGRDLLHASESETELGALKLERTINRSWFYGPKDYILDGESKIKGISKKAIKIGPGIYKQPLFWGFKRMLRHEFIDIQIIETIVKHLQRIYTKGDVAPDGRVTPLVLSLPG